MFQPFKKSRQLFRAEIRQYFSLHLQHRRHFLAGKADHFLKCRVIGDDINLLILDVMVVEPADRLVAPPAIWLDKQSDFHRGNIHLPCPFNKLYFVDDRRQPMIDIRDPTSVTLDSIGGNVDLNALWNAQA
jgi:hypothetical protein